MYGGHDIGLHDGIGMGVWMSLDRMNALPFLYIYIERNTHTYDDDAEDDKRYIHIKCNVCIWPASTCTRVRVQAWACM